MRKRARPLARGLERRERDIHLFPKSPEIAANADGRTQRALIYGKDNTPGARAKLVGLETTSWSKERTILRSVIDSGSTGLPAMVKLYIDPTNQIRGFFAVDVHHQRDKGPMFILKAERLEWVRTEALLLVSVMQGPFTENCNWYSCVELLLEVFCNCDANDPNFLQYYELIVRDLNGGDLPAGFETDAFIHETFAGLESDLIVFQKMGDEAKRSRWFDIWKKLRRILPFFGSMAYIFQEMNLYEDWYDNVDYMMEGYEPTLAPDTEENDRPADADVVRAAERERAEREGEDGERGTEGPLGDGERAALRAGGRALESDDVSNRCVKRSNQPLADRYKNLKSKRALGLAMQIVHARPTRAVMVFVTAIVAPSEKEHNLTVTRLKTDSGARHHPAQKNKRSRIFVTRKR